MIMPWPSPLLLIVRPQPQTFLLGSEILSAASRRLSQRVERWRIDPGGLEQIVAAEPGAAVADKRHRPPLAVDLGVLLGGDRHDIAIHLDQLLDHIGDILDDVERLHLRDAERVVGKIRRDAGLHGGLHLGHEIAEQLGVGGRDIELDALGFHKFVDRVAE